MDALCWENALIGYGKKTILCDVNVRVPAGGFALVYGENGSGKTTLVKSLREGRLLLGGSLKVDPSLKAGIAYIPQQSAVQTFFPLSIFDTVAMGLSASGGITGSLRPVDHRRVMAVLEQLNLAAKPRQLLGECSGGEIKKTLLGRALIKEPRLLIMDEPLVNVDDASRKTILESVVSRHRQQGMTVLLISHGHQDFAHHASHRFHVHQGGVHAE